MSVTTKASEVWKILNGVFCIYKPADLNLYFVRRIILGNLCRDLNDMEVRPPSNYVEIKGDTSKELKVEIRPNYADNPLVSGPRYQPEDFRLVWATYLGKKISGIVMMGINDGTRKSYKLHLSRPTRTYHIEGMLGKLSENMYKDGKVIQKASYKHINRSTMDKILSSVQAAHHRSMFNQKGLDIQSQAAYELALQGPVRPSDGSLPVIYGIKCIHFEPPYFTLEINSINEYEDYFLALVNDIGLKLKTFAMCTGLQCIRHSHFTLENALLRKHWSVQHIVNNLDKCNAVIEENKNLINKTPPALQSIKCNV